MAHLQALVITSADQHPARQFARGMTHVNISWPIKIMGLVLCTAVVMSLAGCSTDDEEYRKAYESAYRSGKVSAQDDAYAKARQPAYAAAESRAYSETRTSIIDSGAFSYSMSWLTSVSLGGLLLGFTLQHRATAVLRQRGILRGDIDRFLLGAGRRIGRIGDWPSQSEVADGEKRWLEEKS